MADDARRQRQDPGSETSFAGCLVRLGWMMIGNVALVLLAAAILMEPRWSLTLKDALFWAVAVAVIALRYLDVTRLGGCTADG